MVNKPTYEELEQRIKELEEDSLKRKQIEKELRESEEKFRLLTEQNLLGVIIIQDGLVKYVNNAAVELTEYSVDEVFNWKPNEFGKLLHPDDLEFVMEQAQNKQAGVKDVVTHYSYRMITESGKVKWVDQYSKTINFNGKTADLITIIDISEQTRAKVALQDSEQTLEVILTASPAGIGFAQDRIIKWGNKTLYSMLGYKEGSLEGKSVRVVYPDDQEYKRVGRELYSAGQVESRWKRKDGSIFDCHVQMNPVNPSDSSKGFIIVAIDITARKQMEEELWESKSKFKKLFDLSPQAIALTEVKTGRLIDVNERVCELTKYSREEIIGKKTTEVFYSEAKREVFLKQLKETKVLHGLEMDFTAKDGSIINALMFSRFIKVKSKSFILTIWVDMTKQKHLQDKLQRAQKMESIGLLAGGIAHDLNNVLSGIVSYPELLLLDLPEDSKLRKPIETIQNSGNRAVDIVQDLLTVARGVATTKQPLNLNDLISDYLKSPEFNNLKQFHPSVTVKPNLDKDIFNIIGSDVHIRKTVMNLVLNASEAIEGDGNVAISTANRYVDRPLRGYDDIKTGEYVILSVSDDGSGISSDDIERIFEPFYTKKVMGRSGTGLGLAVVWNVIQDHKGYIDVRSDGNGTAFKMYFPITRDEVLDEDLSTPIEDYKGDGETILIVDDVETQQDISCKMLDTLGYKTKAVSSGEEAVEYLKEHTIDLIVLDMIMDPGINGHETYERIVKIHPEQKAVIVSGFSESDEVKAAQELGAGKYIKKPFTIEKIGLAVKEELEK